MPFCKRTVSHRTILKARIPVCVAVASLCGFSAQAQESIRPSSTGALSAATRRAVPEKTHYNLKAGPVTMDLTAGVDLEFNDNIGISEKNRQSDFIFRPQLHLDTEWRITRLNNMRLSLGMGFAKYASHSELDTRSILLDPGSELQFDLYVGGNLRLNIHDRFAIVQNPVDEPTLSNTAHFDRFQNSAGITAFWDLNDLKFTFGYDHFTYRSLGKQFNFLDRAEEQFVGSAALRMSDSLTVGLDGSFALVSYKQQLNNNGKSYSLGPFVEAILSDYTRIRVSGGYQGMNFDGNGTNGDTTNFSGFYTNLSISQRLSQYVSHSFNFGHEARLGLTVNFVEYTYARYIADWRMNSRMNVGFEAFCEDANESADELHSEHSFRWGASGSLSYKLGPKTTAAFRYHYVNKNSDLDLRDYYQNIVNLSVSHDF